MMTSKHIFKNCGGWNENTDYPDTLQGFVYKVGRTPNENCKQALEMPEQLREQGFGDLTNDEWSAFGESTRGAQTKSG